MKMSDFSLMHLNCIYSQRLLKKLIMINTQLPENNQINIPEVEKAIIYAKYYHGDQKRDSGEQYYSHPLEVAYMASDYLPRTDLIITAILHDTIEDTELTKEEIEEAFGKQIAEQVYDLTRIKEDGKKISSGTLAKNLYLENKKDLIILKIFDRLHNTKTLAIKNPEKIKKILEETIKDFMVLSTGCDLIFLEQSLKNLCYHHLLRNGLSENKINTSFKLPDPSLPPI